MQRIAAVVATFAIVSVFAPPSLAQDDSVPYPSCLVLPGSAPPMNRFIPPEAKGPAAGRLRGVVARSLAWRPGQTLKMCFKSGTDKARERVVRYAREWMQYANLVFDFGEAPSFRTCQGDNHEDVKIDFKPGGGWVSLIGTLSKQRDPSMNLQFLGVDTPTYPDGRPIPEPFVRKFVLHEFGHVLGMLHEHQSPSASCDVEINWEAAYAIGKGVGWDPQQVNSNFRQLIHTHEFNLTDVDRKSIMHYSLPPEVFKAGKNSRCWVPENLDLSDQDKSFIASVYPKSGPQVVAGGPGTSVSGPAGTTRGAKMRTPSDERDAVVKNYEELLAQSGVTAAKARQLAKEFRETLPANSSQN
jgi:hypothetical protein